VWKQEGYRALRRHRLYEDNIQINLKEIACQSVDWIYMGQDKHAIEVWGSIKSMAFVS
jgi:hypothetical protein